ncbi:MAG: ATP-dependent transcriptional regulator [Rhodobacterales bacterium]|nr:MAG: ATP-dependent transcriptional regulator [Rhodobacterales bacterium]
MRAGVLLIGLVLAGCGAAERPQSAPLPSRSAVKLPPVKHFSATRAVLPLRSNRDIARDFLDLSFAMESGAQLAMMTRFEGPISLRVIGQAPASLFTDLTQLLKRLKTEAGIGITRRRPSQPANITIEVVSKAQLRQAVPNAACFVVPNVSSWAEFRRKRHKELTSWRALKSRQNVTIFLPGDVSPQEIRDCLHEELAQALGPLNDLYRLPDSVFNDDNFHTVLTGFDMLVLRAYYSPRLHNGMRRGQVAAVLPQILARLNPGGQNLPSRPAGLPTPRSWIKAIETALGAKSSLSARRAAAKRAVAIANALGWNGPRLGFSYYVLGRVALSSKTDIALAAFLKAGMLYRSSPSTRIQAAHVALQLAVFALVAGDDEAVLKLADAHLPTIYQAQNASLLATFLMVKSQALELTGRASEARAVQQESLGWARYGLGSDREVRERLNEIRALTPPRRPQA